MKKSLSIIIILSVFILASCTKEQSGSTQKKSSINDLVIPTGFTWENSRDIYFDIKITDTRFPGAYYVVSIYDADPALGGRLLSKGSASTQTHFLTKVYLANTIKEVFIVKTAPDNSATTEKVKVSGANIALSMASAGNVAGSGVDKIKGIQDSPDCSTGCTRTVTTSSNITVNNGETVCITGSNINVGIVAYGGTIRVCGTNVNLGNSTLDNNATLIVTSTGSVTLSSLSLYTANTVFKNYGTTTINTTFGYNGTFLNEGSFVTTGDLNVYAGSNFTNNGTVNIGGSLYLSTSNQVPNNGSITIANDLQVNSGSIFINNCSVWAKRDYINSGTTRNYNLLKANSNTQIYSGSELGLYNGAMLKTANITISGTVRGNGSASIVKVSGNSTIYNNATVTGPLQYCDANGIENKQITFTGGAVEACDLYIPVTNCNTEGNGTAPAADSDGDGVMDALDEYPNDPTKAYNNYYPSSSPKSGATVAFEDQWPAKGDYDLNDVVVSYRYQIVTNASNNVVQVIGNYKLHAAGTGYHNGFGIEFPVSASNVSSLSGGTLESGQDKAVVILFTDVRNELSQWNTRPADKVVAEPKNYTITFNVKNGSSLSTFGLGSYNPFIWNGGPNGGRAYEVHLPGKTPTSLANKNIYGTGDDNSNVGLSRYYVTKTGLPWAIDIPVSTFDYPIEEAEIIEAYLKFQQWAESGGKQFEDWYSAEGAAYRNESKIYKKP